MAEPVRVHRAEDSEWTQVLRYYGCGQLMRPAWQGDPAFSVLLRFECMHCWPREDSAGCDARSARSQADALQSLAFASMTDGMILDTVFLFDTRKNG